MSDNSGQSMPCMHQLRQKSRSFILERCQIHSSVQATAYPFVEDMLHSEMS